MPRQEFCPPSAFLDHSLRRFLNLPLDDEERTEFAALAAVPVM
eukprot:CAMPEP_0183302724 /NCGR_PEP_ID=MMETSP0160_2-20130417/8410_1 /TAXON_ID=2839 ORGANISM="Odontella Sinensis, Strain Grunow 1884" /NCGR_SAMPLE_ID=MMETSP0160_2 /ASSEMBLY_ACC=CAM_ASM_000250 /LENGTH=42 /DNA_ID= /DNA_START= /DNA_END= /DNA_ORIENTATION=